MNESSELQHAFSTVVNVCNETRYMNALFEEHGEAYRYAACFTQRVEASISFLSYLSWQYMRTAICEIREVFDFEFEKPIVSTNISNIFSLLGAFILLSHLLRACFRSRKLHRRGEDTLMIITACALILCFFPAWYLRSEDTSSLGFFYEDNITNCALDLHKTFPNAIRIDRLYTIIVLETRLYNSVHSVLDTKVGDVSLRDVCGTCAMQFFARDRSENELILHLIMKKDLQRPMNRLVSVSFTFPLHTTSAWRKKFAEEISVQHPQILGLSQAQYERDVQASVDSRSMLGPYTFGIVFFVMLAGTLDVVLCLQVLFVLLIVLLFGITLCAAIGIPFSPYNRLITPLIVGTGVDSALIFFDAFSSDPTKIRQPVPSIIASHLTTIFSFFIGLILPVQYVRFFFAQCIMTLAISLVMQLCIFPGIVIRRNKRRQPISGRMSRIIIYISFLCVMISLVFCSFNFQLPVTKFDLRHQLATFTATYRGLEIQNEFLKSDYSLVYVRLDGPSQQWENLNDRLIEKGLVPLMQWYPDFQRANVSIDDWISHPLNHIRYGPLVSKQGSLQVYGASYANNMSAYEQAKEMQLLSQLSPQQNVCVANFDRLGSYTLISTLNVLYILACASVMISGITGIVISRWRGIGVLVSIAITYALSFVLICTFKIQLHMMSISALLVSPGIVVDFSMHLALDPFALRPVFWSACSNAASMIPLMMSNVRGVSDFAIVFSIFVCVGFCCASISSALHIFKYDVLQSAESELPINSL